MLAIERGQAELDARAGHLPTIGNEGVKPIRFRFLTFAQLLAQPPTLYTVLRVVPRRGLIVLWGASGSGKTFVALDLAAAVSRGTPWAGHRTRRGTVVYICTEGALQTRAKAYLKHHDLSEDELEGLHILPAGINLLASEEVEILIADLRGLAKRVGGIAVITLDTLNRAIPGGDENSSEDMGRAIAAAKRIEEALDCAVILVHHGGKDAQRGPRGHSSLKAAADAELMVERDGEVRTVKVEKSRDGADGETILTFRLQVVDLGPASEFDPDAEPEDRITSCVVMSVASVPDAGGRRSKPTKLPKETQIYVRALREVLSERGETMTGTSAIPPGTKVVTIDAWRERAYVADPVDLATTDAKQRERDADARLKRFKRAQRALQNTEPAQIGVVNNLVWIY